MLTPELVTTIGAALAAVLGAWNARQGRQLKELQKQVGNLTSWRTTATDYIGQLLFVMRSHGVTPPPPPASLGLAMPEPPDPDPGPDGDEQAAA